MIIVNYNSYSIIFDGPSKAKESLLNLLFKIMIEPKAI